jgi:antitoxin (DNA-binding transcriptional repressor) of toxin-antitoxin stability system
MHTVTLEEAQAHLPELIAETQGGGEIVITRDDKPVAKLAAAGLATESGQTLPRRSLLGLLEGKVIFHEGWEETPEEFKPYME